MNEDDGNTTTRTAAPRSTESTLHLGGPARVIDPLQVPMGTRIGRYVVLDLLGQGGMGVVYEAVDTRLGRTIALKLHTGDADQAGRARMLREAEALAKLNHPNVVTVYDGGAVDDLVYVAMERVYGVSLKRFVAERTLSTDAVVELFVKAGHGLAAAHRVGIVHRDFKPSNVMVDEEGRVRVIDFGLVRLEGHSEPADRRQGSGSSSGSSPQIDTRSSTESQTLTVLGAYLGTPAYMSPEQHLGRPADYRSDQFSFCVSLFESLTGHLPFHFHSSAGFADQVASRAWHPSGAALPADIRRVLGRGLCADPGQRYADLDALLDDLKARKRRRRARSWTVGALGALGLVLAVVWMSGAPRRACLANAEGVNRTWDDAARARVRSAFVAVAADQGASTFVRVDATLRRFVTEFRAQVREACELSYADKTQSLSLLQDRLECLAAAERRVDGAIAQWEHPTQATLNFGASDAIETAHVHECGRHVDPRTIERRPPGVSQDDYLGFLRLFDEVQRLQRSGDLDAAKAIAEPLVLSAREDGAEGILARALGALGNTQRMLSEYQRAKANLMEAIELSVRVGDVSLEIGLMDKLAYAHLGADELSLAQAVSRLALPRAVALGMSATEMTLILVDAFAYEEQGDFAAAENSMRRALTVAKTKLEPHAEARVTASLAQLLTRQMRYEDALPLAEEGHRVLSDQFGPSHPKSIRALRTLAQVYRGLRRLDDAERCYRDAVKFAPSTSSRVNALSQLGSVQLRRGQYREAVSTLSEARGVQREIHGAEHNETLRSAGILAVALTKSGDWTEARRHFEHTLVHLHGSEGTDRVVVLVNSSYLELEAGHYDVVYDRLSEAEHLSVKLFGDLAVVPFVVRSLRAQALERQGRYADSVTQHRRAFERVEQLESVDLEDLAAARVSLATALCRGKARGAMGEGRKLLTSAQVVVQDSVDPGLKQRFSLAEAACL